MSKGLLLLWNLKILFFLWHFFTFILIFTVYNLNNWNFWYKTCKKFNKKQVGQYQDRICVLKFDKFHLLLKLFNFLLFLTIYNSDNSTFMYKKISKFHNKQFGGYSNGISVVMKFENFVLFILLLYLFTNFYYLQFK